MRRILRESWKWSRRIRIGVRIREISMTDDALQTHTFDIFSPRYLEPILLVNIYYMLSLLTFDI